ncbi:hypothetical protein AAFC00_002263 [Neodothiora populina]|uniref:FHA domain-containing protein n=1 Tax=Neodothiora populina TaxID=2781224 RepID=A0ABR3PGU7_9PEZI
MDELDNGRGVRGSMFPTCSSSVSSCAPSSQEQRQQQQQQKPQPARRPSLLPAFEPCMSSSPVGLPKTMKRKFDQHNEEDQDDAVIIEKLNARKYYPTPVPTSSTGILPSSPDMRVTRPKLQRDVSSLSERAPLGAVPTLRLHTNGDPVLMGRSSNSSDYQLSANRLISRVHVRATYHAPEGSRLQGEVVVECVGWNGAKIHYQGSVVELAKGESFVSQKPGTQIMVDVQETRVLLAWPRSTSDEDTPDWGWQEASPTNRTSAEAAQRIASSPPPLLPSMQSPISPSPDAHDIDASFEETFIANDDGVISGTPVQVYEDHATPEDDEEYEEELPGMRTPVPISRGSPVQSKTSTPSKTPRAVPVETSGSAEPEELSEHDEENDPIVHSFGPFGENLLSRFESFTSTSPDRRRHPLKTSLNANTSPRIMPSELSTIRQKTASPVKAMLDSSPVKNHVINQLAFSRVHSLPLSTIFNNLPSDMKGGRKLDNLPALSAEHVKSMMDRIPCVGEIRRQGKDAAGKALEDEFYYVPEMDTDEHRRAAVSIAKPPLRATRKQHKQYYWKKPRH